jgi:hypothetical protein
MKQTILEEESVLNLDQSSEVQFSATHAMDDQMENENFTQRLDQLILDFRKETMQEFIKTKGRISHLKEQAIDAEKRRCNTLLAAKQSEIE